MLLPSAQATVARSGESDGGDSGDDSSASSGGSSGGSSIGGGGQQGGGGGGGGAFDASAFGGFGGSTGMALALKQDGGDEAQAQDEAALAAGAARVPCLASVLRPHRVPARRFSIGAPVTMNHEP
jgi:hypothetical protein